MMTSPDPKTSPGFALSRALIEALLTPLTPEELAEARAARAAGGPEFEPPEGRGVHHLSVQPDAEPPSRPRRGTISDEEWERQQIRDENGWVTHTPEGEPLKHPLPPGVRFRPRRSMRPPSSGDDPAGPA